MSVLEIICQRGISEILHFTTNHGLVGILATKGLLSRYRLPSEKYLEHVWRANAHTRAEAFASFDKTENWLDYVNLSISEVNSRYFLVSTKWHQDYWWVVLSFDSSIMAHEGVYFATTNNSYDMCSRARGAEGLSALFAPYIRRKSPNWGVSRLARPDWLATCEQAEVLYPERVSTDALRKVYVREDEQADKITGWLREFGLPHVEVVVSTQKFDGVGN